MDRQLKQAYEKRKLSAERCSFESIWVDAEAVIHYHRREAQDKKRRHERCANCAVGELFVAEAVNIPVPIVYFKYHQCKSYKIIVKPYWHMACFKERE